MTIEHLPPGLLLIVGALLLPLLPYRLRQIWLVTLPVLGLAHLWSLPLGASWSLQLFDYRLEPMRVDSLSRVFGTVFHIAALVSAVFALQLRSRLQHTSAMIYAGAAIAAAFAGDLITLFVYWELTAISSVFLIWARRTDRSLRSGMRYLIIQVGSGVLLLAGTLVHSAATGSITFGHLGLESPGGLLIFLAFGIKAAFPLMHNWLQDSYPEATITGTVFLSAFTTKLAIYALARGFAGTEILVPIGAVMTAFPIFYAVIENDLRRVLAYSLNNQLGFMVVGIGIGTELALNGTAAHAFAHILYKGLLFMSMGAVLYRTGTIKASQLGGLYKSMPWTTGFCIIGSLSISAFPLLSGFVSKGMILAAAAEEHRTITFLVLLFASAGVCDHSGIKIPFFAFFAHDNGWRVKEAPWNMLLAMGVTAGLCIAIGVWPEPLYAMLPYAVTFEPYTTAHVITQLQLLMFAGLAFAVMMRTGIYPPEVRSVNVDFDWTYRKALPAVGSALGRVGGGLLASLQSAGHSTLDGILGLVRRTHSPPGMLGEPWPTGSSTLWAAILLSLYLLLEFL